MEGKKKNSNKMNVKNNKYMEVMKRGTGSEERSRGRDRCSMSEEREIEKTEV